LAILALDDSSRRRTLSLYLLARLAQVSNNQTVSMLCDRIW
jgi:hypothetical protein